MTKNTSFFIRILRLFAVLSSGLGFACLAACSLIPDADTASPSSAATPPPAATVTAPETAVTDETWPTLTAEPAPTETIPPSPSAHPSGTYINDEYQFSFDLPEGWALEEGTWDEPEGTLHYTYLIKDLYRIVFQYKTVFEDVFISPRGMPQGELFQTDEIPILGREITGYRLDFEERTKMVFFGIKDDELRFFAGLSKLEGPDLGYTYEEIDIPKEIQDDFSGVLQSMERTGIVALPESMTLLAEFPLILGLEKFYYSQIYDTDVANACGPATALMVLDYYGIEDSMDVVIEALQTLPSPGAYDPDCYVNTICTSPDALTMLFYNYGLGVVPREDWTLSEVFAVISSGNPVIADILWDPETASLGHFVVIYGVDLSQERLYYHDPYRGREMTASWDEFANAWEGQVDVGDPLKPEGHRFWGLEVRP